MADARQEFVDAEWLLDQEFRILPTAAASEHVVGVSGLEEAPGLGVWSAPRAPVHRGSKMRSRTSSGIPPPVSEMLKRANRSTESPIPASSPGSRGRKQSRLSVLPPSGMASRAFATRFMITCSSCAGSTRTRSRPGASCAMSEMSSPINRASVAAQLAAGRMATSNQKFFSR